MRQESPCNEPSADNEPRGVTFTSPKSVLDELIPWPSVTTNICCKINSLHEIISRSAHPVVVSLLLTNIVN